MTTLVALGALASVFSLMCLGAGLSGLTQAKPYVFNFRWISWVYIALILIGIAVTAPEIFRQGTPLGFRVWALLAWILAVGLVAAGWLRDGDFTVVGASWEDFQAALDAALQAEAIPHAAIEGGVRLSEPEAIIGAANFLDSVGFIQLSIRPRRFQPRLKALAARLNERFAADPGQPNLRAFRVFTGAGGLGAVLALMLIAGALIG